MTGATKWGSEFLVNTTTSGDQNYSDIAGLANGRFVVTWTDPSQTGGDTSGDAIRAQLFNADGSKHGSEFIVPTTTDFSQDYSSVTALPGGGFAVTWVDTFIRTQLFDSDGNKVGTEALNSDVANGGYPAVGALAGGGYVLTWMNSDADASGISAQIFAADGSKVGNDFLVNTTETGEQADPAVTGLAGGRFVVTWTDQSQSGGDPTLDAVRGQVFDATGAKIGGEFLVNTTTANAQVAPSVAALANGGFVTTWMDYSASADDPSGTAVRMQVFDADGGKVGTELLVNTHTLDAQFAPDVTALTDGRFVVVWADGSHSADDISSYAVRAQVFEADGTRSGDEFLVNTTTANEQTLPTVTALADGRFAVAFVDGSLSADDPSGYAIRGQIFDPRDAAVSLTGTGLGDDLIGTGFDDTFGGSAGNDHLDGAGGIDTLDLGAAKKALLVDLLAGTASGVSIGSDVVTGFENVIGGAGTDSITGDGADNQLSGGGASDTLDGGAGTDTMDGGGGNDSFIVDNAADSLIEAPGGGNDTAYASATFSLAHFDDVENLTLTGAGANDGTGNGGANVLTGNGAANLLDGGGGADTMIGGGGDDSFHVDNAGDVVSEGAGAGSGQDTVFSYMSYTLGANLENLTLVGSLGVNGTGNGLGNLIYGNGGSNILDGSTGNDTMIAAGGADTLIAGAGKDLLTGGGGLDRMVFKSLSDSGTTFVQRDVINTFAHGDKVDVSAIDANGNAAGNQAFTFVDHFTHAAGQLQWDQTAPTGYLIQGDVNGDGAADFSLQIYAAPGFGTIHSWDFIL